MIRLQVLYYCVVEISDGREARDTSRVSVLLACCGQRPPDDRTQTRVDELPRSLLYIHSVLYTVCRIFVQSYAENAIAVVRGAVICSIIPPGSQAQSSSPSRPLTILAVLDPSPTGSSSVPHQTTPVRPSTHTPNATTPPTPRPMSPAPLAPQPSSASLPPPT
jgi:hypothetical protein